MTRKLNTTKLVALLAVLCMITSAFVGSTLAKYTTSGTGTDSARVAKFGVTVTATSDTAFAKEYAKDSDTTIAKTVVSENYVVAPGTTGTLTDVTIAGTPEVAIKVEYEPTLTLEGWTASNAEYCPLEITVEGKTYKIGGGTGFEACDDIADLKAKVEAAIADCNAEYEAGEITLGTDAPSVSWKWAFTGNDDAKDTELGNATDAATVKLELTTRVTQID